MDFFKRLSDYDIFAYVPQGFLALAASDYLFGGNHFVLHANWDIAKGLLIFFLAYVAGHVVASPSSWLLERGLVGRCLGQPTLHLLSPQQHAKIAKLFFANYFSAVSEPLRSDALRKMGIESVTKATAERAYWSMYSVAKRDDSVKPRLATFLNLYGFCRNTSFVFGATAMILVLELVWCALSDHPYPLSEHISVAVVCALVSFVMFQRYLKFFRLYAVEVITSFVTPPVPPGN